MSFQRVLLSQGIFLSYPGVIVLLNENPVAFPFSFILIISFSVLHFRTFLPHLQFPHPDTSLGEHLQRSVIIAKICQALLIHN